MDEKTALAYAITRAIAYTENGGKPTTPKAGKTGELKSIFQFTPATWKNYAQQILGDPNAPLTADNETQVVVSKVQKWLDEGKTAKQIASMWNAGTGEPDAWTGKFSNGHPSVGVNKQYGVPFNVPAYANKVANYAKNFYQTDFAPQVTGGAQASAEPQGMGTNLPGNPFVKSPTVAATTPAQTQQPIQPQQKVAAVPSNTGRIGQLLQSLASAPVA